ncbi:ABC transporter ATP-binding protein [Aeromicrobium sp. UC242_57]|uniref:ABC transporter ATP-binding protein n=1 Tax=Aeromicrobium sp. UC242_57 TaxID=3374624 RepID=UPI0037BDCEFD
MTFGGVVAVKDVSFSVAPGEIVGVIGPNGSGKSTLINVMTGFYRPTHGSVSLDGETLSGLSPEAIRRAGIARTFQNLRLVQEMSVRENAVAGLYLQITGGRSLTQRWLADMFATPAARRRAAAARDAAELALAQVGLQDKLDQTVSALSYADQKRLELARAIALRPKVLVLDEPTAGMSVDEADELIRMVTALVESDGEPMSLFLVEHRLELVLDVSHRAVVMDGGQVIADGLPDDVARDPHVRSIYVGGE